MAVLSEEIKSRMEKITRERNVKATRPHTCVCVDGSYGPKPSRFRSHASGGEEVM
jgi:hypothetical protein